MKRMLAAMAAVASAVPANAAVPGGQLDGVWDGTIGTLPVRACFVHKSYGDHGAYYYRSKLVTIPLIADDKRTGEFTENWADQKGPRWKIGGAVNGVLTGQWTSRGKSLPLRLSKVPMESGENESTCGSRAFFEPRDRKSVV